MREIKFRALNNADKHILKWAEINHVALYYFMNANHYTLMQFTGFKDSDGKEIYEGDIFSDLVETDEGVIESKQQVFWNNLTGSWHLDSSFKQDTSNSTELWRELEKYKYKIKGNIYEN